MENSKNEAMDKIIREKLATDPKFKEFVEKFQGNQELLMEVLDEVLEEIIDDSDPYRCKPVSSLQFIEDPYFCGVNPNTGDGVASTIYPKLKEDFVKVHTFDLPYKEVILSGSIGFGKSFWMSLGLIWNLYYLSTLKNPQKYFGLASSAKIAIMIISITEKQAKKNMFHNVKNMIQAIPYFRENFMFDMKKSTDSLIFPNNIELFSGTSSQSSTIGLNIFSAALDEANFFKVIEQSKRSRGNDGEYDEALTLYNSLLRRQESRFMKKGRKPGILYLGSSAVYPNDFTAQRVKASKEAKKALSYVMSYSQWSVCREKYSDEEFMVEIGGLNKQNRILEGHETDISGEIIKVPVDFYDAFKKDLDNSIRDIAGIALYSVQPFIGQKEFILKMFDSSLPKIFSQDKVTLSPKPEYMAVEKILKTRPEFPNRPRYIAMDIGLKKDRFGLAMGYIENMALVKREFFNEETQQIDYLQERLPIIVIEMVLEIVPEAEFGEVELSRVRYLILKLKQYGYRIRYSSADGFQSADMQQILRRKGVEFEYISMDKTTEPYETFRNALYEERIKCVYHPRLEKELNELERNYVSDRVDHPVKSSKDLADAVGQLVYNCHINSHFEDDSLLVVSMASESSEETKSVEQTMEDFDKWVTGGLIKTTGQNPDGQGDKT